MHETGIKALGTERQQLRYFSHVDSLTEENEVTGKSGNGSPGEHEVIQSWSKSP